jgi:hypothetical protein
MEQVSLATDPVVKEAQERFKKCQDWEANCRKLFVDDLKFANADSDNGYQWPNDIRRNRDVDERPCLTIPIVRQHNLQIINDAKQNKASIAVRGTGNGATYEAAQVYASVIRYIEYHSNASVAYDTATKFQVEAGWGNWVIETDYVDENSFDQEIFIREVPDPLMIYLDPNSTKLDRSDAKFGFIFKNMPKDEFDREYPELKDRVGPSALGGEDDWITRDHIRVATYYRVVETDKTLVSFVNPMNGTRSELTKDNIPEDIREMVLEDPETVTRPTKARKVEWKRIIGGEVHAEGIWPGKYIPIVMVVGQETLIEGQPDRAGHTRFMKDPQRMYNYWTSAAVEQVALQGKSPYIAPSESIEGLETYWESANRVNHAVLPYNGFDDAGNPLPPPQRAQPPQMAQAYLQGMTIARNEIQMASGQYEPNMGQQGNERTGAALNARQRKGDNATYHFVDNLAVALRYTGKILLDLIPKIYDTRRVMMILAEDGTSQEIEVDPQAREAYVEQLDHDQKVVKRIFNPNVGKYEIQAFDALTLILTQAPQMAGVIGDILLRAGDFPGAEEAAIRLKRMVPPQALGQGPTQNEKVLMAEGQKLQGALQQLMMKSQKQEMDLAGAKLSARGKDEMRDIDAYEAQTKRLAALQPMLPMDAQGLQQIIHQLVGDALQTHLDQITQANAPDLMAQRFQGQATLQGLMAQAQGQWAAQGQGAAPPQGQGPGPAQASGPNLVGTPHPTVPEARLAPDGHYYAPDPTRPGGYARVVPGA